MVARLLKPPAIIIFAGKSPNFVSTFCVQIPLKHNVLMGSWRFVDSYTPTLLAPFKQHLGLLELLELSIYL